MQKIKDVIPSVLSFLSSPELKKKRNLLQSWSSIAGPYLSKHTRPSLAKNGHLFVWVNEATLAYELNQKHANSFLKRAQAVLGENEIKKISFRVGELR